MRSPLATHWSSWRRTKLPSRCLRSKPACSRVRSKHDGDVVAVDDVLGEIDETARGRRRGAGAGRAAPAAAPACAAPQPRRLPPPRAAPPPPGGRSAERRPQRKRVAAEAGVDLAAIAGTGRGGVVSKPDVIEQAGRGAASAAARGDGAAAAPHAPRQRPRLAHRVAASHAPAPQARARRARRCRRAASASPSICSRRSTRPRTSRRSTRSTCRR